MKLQIDTDNKTIKIENDIKFSKLIKSLKKLFPDNEWKEFILQTNTTINNWNKPYIVERWVEPCTYPWYPTTWTTTYASSEKEANIPEHKMEFVSGTYNVQC